jgi:hypothetical protein
LRELLGILLVAVGIAVIYGVYLLMLMLTKNFAYAIELTIVFFVVFGLGANLLWGDSSKK